MPARGAMKGPTLTPFAAPRRGTVRRSSVEAAGRTLMPATELTLGVTLAVLGAGLLHAGWNALLKSAPGGDPLLDTATVVAGAGVLGTRGHSVRRRVPTPPRGCSCSCPWRIHWAYYITLAPRVPDGRSRRSPIR